MLRWRSKTSKLRGRRERRVKGRGKVRKRRRKARK